MTFSVPFCLNVKLCRSFSEIKYISRVITITKVTDEVSVDKFFFVEFHVSALLRKYYRLTLSRLIRSTTFETSNKF